MLFSLCLGLGTISGFAQIATQNNPHGKIKNACSDCHTTKGWSPLRLDIKFKHEKTGFALEGRHALTECKACHTNLLFTSAVARQAGASKDCKSCHVDAHDGTLGVDCARCHTFQSWQDVSRIATLHQTTRFPLFGRHQHVGCDDCHQVQNETQFINMPLACFPCHQQDYAATTDPNHQAAGFPANCEQCHGAAIETWTPVAFSHPATFPLTFGHATASCDECHVNQFKGTSTDCFACHRSDYESTRDPDHRTAGYSTDCRSCHSTQNWNGTTVDHSFFPLTGAHATAECISCHANNRFQGTPRDCFSCHQSDFASVADPNHMTGNFSHDCLICHATSAWEPATFDHNRTRFALTGAHQAVACDVCHVNGQYAGTPLDCYSCHQSDFTNVTDPNHVSGNFSHDCLTCHTTSAWTPAIVDHNATAFPLTGAHQLATCDQCHKNGVFAGTPKDCYSCHQTDFANVTGPNHVAGNFSHDCLTCHTTSAWTPATFDHNNTAFPLLGAHQAVACASCHVNNVFAGTPKDCYSCHQDDFQRPTDPNHVTLNFSQDCLTCHTMTAWTPATFDHDAQFFPIYSGAHRNKWQACSTCHVDASNYKVFECINCHEHNQQKMDDKHLGKVNNYQYNSAACYSCHPDGKG